MDSIENMRTFLIVCQARSFVQAARRLGLSPSVVTKRVTQLEWQLKMSLLDRTTRSVRVTEDGKHQLGAIEQLVRDHELLVTGLRSRPGIVEGLVRVSAPAALATTVLAGPLAAFHQAHPAVTLDLTVLDRSVNPVEEGFDLSLVVLPVSFDGVQEEVLCRYPRVLCAAPDYLDRAGLPAHPRDLAQHTCISYGPSGTTWTFQSPTRRIHVPVRPAITATDSRLVIELVRQGAGLGIMSLASVWGMIKQGELVPVLTKYPVPQLEVRAFTPERKHFAPVYSFIRFIGEALKRQEGDWERVFINIDWPDTSG